MTMLVGPRVWSDLTTDCWTPAVWEVSAMTEATPMAIASISRKTRSLFSRQCLRLRKRMSLALIA